MNPNKENTAHKINLFSRVFNKLMIDTKLASVLLEEKVESAS